MFYKSLLTLLIVAFDQLKNGFTNCVPTTDHRTFLRPSNSRGESDPYMTTSESNNPFMSRKDFNESIDGLPSSLDYYPSWLPESCDEDEVYSSDLKKCLEKSYIMDECISSEQCIVPQSACHYNVCRCTEYYYESGRYKCVPIHNTAIEIYKITMIFASSCLALILLIFLACILRKSYCPADSTHQVTGRSAINDLFTIYPGTSGSPSDLFGNLTPAEKPPSYSETMRMINQEIGTPPPAYHNIFYTEASSTETTLPVISQTSSTANNIINNNNNVNNCEQSSVSSSSSFTPTSTILTQSHLTTNNGLLLPATASTINAQNCNLYSLSQSRVNITPSAPDIGYFNQGQVNSAFSSDS